MSLAKIIRSKRVSLIAGLKWTGLSNTSEIAKPIIFTTQIYPVRVVCWHSLCLV